MPKRAQYTLMWQARENQYELREQEHILNQWSPGDSEWWVAWLADHASFAFRGKQGHLTLLKESRARGDDYWYAYRSLNHHTRKKYAGRTADLTLERLEELAALFSGVAEARASIEETERSENRTSGAGSQGGQFASSPLLEPKFHAPRLPAALVRRERLFARLQTGLECRLTLLCAPAGFGKTTLVAQWLDECRARSQLPVAWISLDSSDNDPVRFWRYLITACQRFHPVSGQTSLEQLSAALQPPFTLPPMEMVLTELLNDLTRLQCDGMLVLEDYHVITEAPIHQAMTFFLEHLPPTFRVMMLTRSSPPLPLVRWRARGDLCEIQAADLRFSSAEMERFFLQSTALPPGSFSVETLNQLDTRLEGWAVGLRLLSLALQGNIESWARERALATFADEQRSLQDYFVTEVLNGQEELLQDFLLRTSVLNHLSGPLCDAITGGNDGEQFLEMVERAGLFLEPLEGSQRWYRYHALFAEAMRAEARRRFDAGTFHALFRRASQWYEQQGMFAEAVEAAFEAQDAARAGALIEQYLEKVKYSLFNPQNYQGFHTFRRWFEQLPTEMLLERPFLAIGYAAALLFILVVEQRTPYPAILVRIEELLCVAEEGFRRADSTHGLGRVLAFRALITREQGATRAAVAYAEQALTLLSEDDPEWRGVILNVIGMGKLLNGDLAVAQQMFLALCAFYGAFDNRAIRRANAALLHIVTFERGELRQATEFFQQMLAEGREEDDRDDIAHAQLMLAWIAYERNDLFAAEQSARETARLGQLLGNEEFHVQAELILARIEHVHGQTGAALQRCSALLARLPATTPLRQCLARDIQVEVAQIQLANGDLAAAQHWIANRGPFDEEFYFANRQREEWLVARCLLAQNQAREALDLLSCSLITLQQRGYGRFVLKAQILMVLAHASLGETREARQLLHVVLANAHPEGYRRLFLDEGEALLALLRSTLPLLRERHLVVYAQAILRAAASAGQGDAPVDEQLAEPLSAQEQRVLRLLAAGRSNPEIARELVVSINTIKVHVQSIYRKLNVNNRVGASEVARLLQLL